MKRLKAMSRWKRWGIYAATGWLVLFAVVSIADGLEGVFSGPAYAPTAAEVAAAQRVVDAIAKANGVKPITAEAKRNRAKVAAATRKAAPPEPEWQEWLDDAAPADVARYAKDYLNGGTRLFQFCDSLTGWRWDWHESANVACKDAFMEAYLGRPIPPTPPPAPTN